MQDAVAAFEKRLAEKRRALEPGMKAAGAWAGIRRLSHNRWGPWGWLPVRSHSCMVSVQWSHARMVLLFSRILQNSTSCPCAGSSAWKGITLVERYIAHISAHERVGPGGFL
jgi:hypothetical protein